MPERPETGPMQFGDDWPGIFLRGDDAARHFSVLHNALTLLDTGKPVDPITRARLDELAALLASCNALLKPEVQRAALEHRASR